MSALRREICSGDNIVVVETVQGRIALRIRVEQIDLAALKGFSEGKFVDHAKIGVFTQEGCGLSGGGDATDARQLRLDLENLPEVELEPKLSLAVGAGRTSLGQLNTTLDHDQLANVHAAQHVDHSEVEVEAGDGLSGGGTLESTITLRLALNRLERVSPTASMMLAAVDTDKTHGRIEVGELFELFRLWLKEQQNALAA